MRILKDEKYESILTAARDEFTAKGFKGASMRGIAQKADVGLSNIYNYFKSKNDLFLAIVKPVRDEMFLFIAEQHTEEHIESNRISAMGHKEGTIEHFIRMIEKNKQEIRLLFCHSEGSSMTNFRNEFADHLTGVSNQYMKLEKKHYPLLHEVSPFFIHVMCSWMVSVVCEIVTHDLNRQKIREFFREYFRFEFAGWRELTGT